VGVFVTINSKERETVKSLQTTIKEKEQEVVRITTKLTTTSNELLQEPHSYMYTYIRIYIHIYACIHIYTYICMQTYIHTYIHTYVCLYVCIYVCMYVCMYVCLSVCMYEYIYIYIYTHIYILACVRGKCECDVGVFLTKPLPADEGLLERRAERVHHAPAPHARAADRARTASGGGSSRSSRRCARARQGSLRPHTPVARGRAHQ
jgi:hypothetical protein